MKLVIQRVTNASVEVEGEITGQIEEGLLVLVGFGQTDSEKEVEYLARKLCKLRIFPDDEGRMNRSVQDIGGKLLLVPQFTLYGKTKKNRPSFHKALVHYLFIQKEWMIGENVLKQEQVIYTTDRI